MAQLVASPEAHSQIEDSEHIYLEICRRDDLFECSEVDWTTLGVISQVLSQLF